ncbi:oligosaccharide flippase family protein [Novosphingobium sp. FGD1]|uniref:Oligosaccharide flippase family protein n=1 Tax=Novosphingobium silvae TaxID=2692619 RepID=A0A7X4GJW7_9SPHN|nr:oligosaccharide flippase family protein [Novosphingobium silvae]MYL99556.1 oligosaccharide flippase family protein [Novosphingobium silvae]
MIKRLVKNSSAVLGGQLISVGISFIQSVILARFFGPEQFGKWALLIASSSLIGNFLGFRTAEALTSFWIEAKEDGDTAAAQRYLSSSLLVEFITKLISGVVSFIVGVALLGALDASADIIAAAALIGLFRFLSFADAAWVSLMRDAKRIYSLSFVPVMQISLQMVLVTSLVWGFSGRLFLAALGYVLSQAVSLVVKLNQLRDVSKNMHVHVLRRPHLGLLRRDQAPAYWRMMVAGYFTSCLSSLMKEGDTLVVGLVASDSSVGFYRLARSLVSIVQLANQAIATLILQDFSALRREGPAAILAVVRRIAVPFAVIVMFSCLLLALALPHVITFVYGSAYLGAVLPFRILLVGTAISTSLFWVTPALVALREMRAMLTINIVNFTLFVIAMAVGIHYLRGVGPAVATSAAWAFGYGASLFWLLFVIWRERGFDERRRSC